MHIPVLLKEAIELLNVKKDGVYVDGTFGRGGHAEKILNKLGENGRLIAFDKDVDAVNYAKEKFAKDKRLLILHDDFANVHEQLHKHNISFIDGILLDLGVSSPQLDEKERGFSFNQDAMLDMRLDNTKGISAKDWVNQVDENDLANVLWKFGEERFSRRIAKNIVLKRAEYPIETTKQLAEIIKQSVPHKKEDKHPATRCFQAIRIFINDELGSVEKVLEQIPSILNKGGRVVIISFHSLEDRMVKTQFNSLVAGDKLPKWVMQQENETEYKMVAKKVRASESELKQNVRSRSAILRCLERVESWT